MSDVRTLANSRRMAAAAVMYMPVADDRGIRQALRDGLLVRGGHIDCDGCNAVALLLADEVEEGAQGLGGLPLSRHSEVRSRSSADESDVWPWRSGCDATDMSGAEHIGKRLRMGVYKAQGAHRRSEGGP